MLCRSTQCTEVPGTEDERRYRTGVTRGLGDVAAGRSHITELRTVEAYRLYGDMDRIKVRLRAYGSVPPWLWTFFFLLGSCSLQDSICITKCWGAADKIRCADFSLA